MQIIPQKEIIKSPLNFTGGKYKLLPQLIPLFPNKINTFIDLFCGGCNVGLNICANKIICNDNDSKLIGLLNFFNTTDVNNLIPRIKKIIDYFNLSNSNVNGYAFYNCNSSKGLGNYNKQGFISLRNYFNSLNEIDENYYLTLYVLIVFSFNNQIRFNNKDEFNLPVGKRDFNEKMENKLRNFLRELKTKSIIFSNHDFSLINESTVKPDDFIYADPPYLITCATYNEKG